MAKVVKIYIVNEKGIGQLGQRVKVYGGSEQRTDREGCTSLLITSSTVSIYVNGHTAYSGTSSNLDPSEIFTTSGGRP